MVAVAGGLLAARVLVRVARRRTAGVAGPRPRRRHRRLGRRRAAARHLADRVGARGRHLPAAGRRAGLDRRRAQPGRARRGRDRCRGGAAGPGRPTPRALLDAVRAADPDGDYAMAAVQVTTSAQEPQLLAVDASRADRVLELGLARRATRRDRSARRCCPTLADPVRLGPRAAAGHRRPAGAGQPVAAAAHRAAGRRTAAPSGSSSGQLRPGRHTYRAELPAELHRRRLPAGRAGRRPPGHRHRERDRDPADRVGGAHAGRRRCDRAAGRLASGCRARGGPGHRPSAGRRS